MKPTLSEKHAPRARPTPRPEPQPPSHAAPEPEQGARAGLPLFLGQPQIEIGAPDDAYEREADRVAAQVQQRPTAPHTPPPAADSSADRTPPIAAEVQRALGPALDPASGAPLDPAVRTRVEPVLGADLADVRVHSNTADRAAAGALRARAFTHRNHIWLGPQQRADDAPLLAHEATHVVQQASAGSAGTPPVQRQPAPAAAPLTLEPGPAPPPAVQLQDEPASAPANSQQSFNFSEAAMEQRLEGTPGAVITAKDSAPSPETESKLDDVGAKDKNAAPKDGAPDGQQPPTGGPAAKGRRTAGGDGAGPEPIGPPVAATPGPAAAFENLVDAQVGAYLDGNLAPDGINALDPTNQALLQGAAALSERQVGAADEGGLLGNLTGITPLVNALTKQSPGYEKEETWLQVVARIRDIASSLGGVVGMIGLVATVSGAILSLLIPPVGAFLLTVGRFCDIAALVLDAISLVLSGFLTGYNLYRLKNATNPDEKRRLLGLVRQDALNTVMSGIAVATAVAPGASKALANTRLGRTVGTAVSRVTRPIGRGLGKATKAAGEWIGRSALGRGLKALRSGTIGRLHSGLEHLRGTALIQNLNQRASQWEARSLQRLTSSQSRISRAFGRNWQTNRGLADLLHATSHVEHHIRIGDRLKSRLRQLERQGVPPATIQTQLAAEFNVNPNSIPVAPGTSGALRFQRNDTQFLRDLRQQEFQALQQLRVANPPAPGQTAEAYAAQIAALANQRPNAMARWTPGEIQELINRNPAARIHTRTGSIRVGTVPKTPHHTIPHHLAPQLHLEPRYMQMANAPVMAAPYQNFMENANRSAFTSAGKTNVDLVRSTSQASDLIRQGRITGITDPAYFESRQFFADLRRQGGGGLWRNPHNPSEVFLFDEHLVAGHGWSTNDDTAKRIFGPTAVAQDERAGETTRRIVGSGVRQTTRTGPETSETIQSAEQSLADATLPHVPFVGPPPELFSAARFGLNGTGAQASLPPALSSAPATAAASTTASPAGGGKSAGFLAAISARIARPIVSLGAPSATAATADAAPSGDGSAPAATATTDGVAPRQPEIPPTPVPYSPESLAYIQESRESIAAAIEMTQAYISAAGASQQHNQQAVEAAGALNDQHAERKEAIAGEQQDISGQQDKLGQAQGAQQNMSAEGQKASGEAAKGQEQGGQVQSEGSSVSVEAKPEEPSSKSWLERAWDATAGALWEALVRPAINAVKRKVNEIMKSIGEFIMGVINQALGLDEIEAQLDGGGQEIQGKQDALTETTTGLDQTGAQTDEAQQKNQSTIEQAQANIGEAATVQQDAQTLLESLQAQDALLAQEQDAAVAYISAFGTRYQPFFAMYGAQSDGAADATSEPPMSSEEQNMSVAPARPAEPTINALQILPVTAQLGTLQRAEDSAAQELLGVAADSSASISPELQSQERAATNDALSGFQSGQAARKVQLANLLIQAQGCAGLPLDQGYARLGEIMDQLAELVAQLEQARVDALTAIAATHGQAMSIQPAADTPAESDEPAAMLA